MNNEYYNKTEAYNGWTNKATWLTKLWLDNDEPTYKQVMMIKTVEGLREFVQSILDETTQQRSGLAIDLLNFAESFINYDELFEAYQEA